MYILLIMLGTFITLESINAIRLFDGLQHNIIYRVFTSLQHVCTSTAGFVLTWYAYLGDADWKHLIFALSIAAFILSESVYRWVYLIKTNHFIYYCWIQQRFNFLCRRKSDLNKEVNNG